MGMWLSTIVPAGCIGQPVILSARIYGNLAQNYEAEKGGLIYTHTKQLPEETGQVFGFLSLSIFLFYR